MKIDKNQILAAVTPGLLVALALGGTAALLALTLSPEARAAAWALLEPRIALVFMLWLVLAIAGGTLAQRLWHRLGAAPGRLAEALQVQLSTDTPAALPGEGSAGARALAQAVQALVQQRNALRADIAAQVAAASREV